MWWSSILFWFPLQRPICGNTPNSADMDSWSQRWWQLSFGCLILCPCHVKCQVGDLRTIFMLNRHLTIARQFLIHHCFHFFVGDVSGMFLLYVSTQTLICEMLQVLELSSVIFCSSFDNSTVKYIPFTVMKWAGLWKGVMDWIERTCPRKSTVSLRGDVMWRFVNLLIEGSNVHVHYFEKQEMFGYSPVLLIQLAEYIWASRCRRSHDEEHEDCKDKSQGSQSIKHQRVLSAIVVT